MTDAEFDDLIQEVTYDAWIVATDGNGTYYVKDSCSDGIREVILIPKRAL